MLAGNNLLYVVVIIAVGGLLVVPLVANATQQQAYVGILPSGSRVVAGVRTDTATVITPVMSSLGFNNHRDYVAYVMHIDAINGNQGIGAGWLSYKDTSTSLVINYDLIYVKPNGSGPTHNLVNQLSSGSQPRLIVTQNAQSGTSANCWTGQAITGSLSNVYSYCFGTGTFSTGSIAGVTGRTFSIYGAGSNTMPGEFDGNHYYYWNSGVLTQDSSTYFSTGSLVKCYTTNGVSSPGWLIDYKAKYNAGGTQLIDKVDVGPSLATTDDCVTSGNFAQQWELPGE
ncbi:hypothetical protein NTE_01859 [Candidatus Nitrososphaera evergladensis SR1]|uniref:Uncharacterized protein n=1 Tax=Candidatus Nitrososphaera evergladensis SR1 TaxID=1459636 RepID=A0A075MX91_9ARCH|nr:hypothetical protein [Candidatus Nitrososphaera evergladensis]AIF83919.1 hypothetical protein NTE_01859 [Candidatus Nitrososphaera evergladensis SR1]